jgi:hypothetical protein
MPSESGFEWSCFISHRSSQWPLMQWFVIDFYKSLSSEIELLMGSDLKVFLDIKCLKGGVNFEKAIAESLCKSLCMVMIYTPTYFNKNNRFCAREYRAMELLEQQRLIVTGNQGLIIPVVLRGAKYFPNEIKRQYYDFSEFALCPGRISRTTYYRKKLKEIAEIIFEIHNIFEKQNTDFCRTCSSFDLPSDNDPEINRLVLQNISKERLPGRNS